MHIFELLKRFDKKLKEDLRKLIKIASKYKNTDNIIHSKYFTI